MTVEGNKALVREMFTATEEGNFAGLFELLDPDMVLTLAGTTPLSGCYAGGAAVADLTRRVGSLIDHVSLEVTEFGDTALVETALFGKELVETGPDSPKVGAAG